MVKYDQSREESFYVFNNITDTIERNDTKLAELSELGIQEFKENLEFLKQNPTKSVSDEPAEAHTP